MLRSRVIQFAFALLAATAAPLMAQSASTIQLAFGYECGDRFIVKNDGAQPVLVAYAPAGSRDTSQLHLGGKQSAEIAMAEDGNLNLFVAGKLVASAPKGNRPCAEPSVAASPSAPASDTAVVRPPDQPPAVPLVPDSTALSDSTKHGPPAFVFLPPTDIVIVLPNEAPRFYVYYPHPSATVTASASSVSDERPRESTKSSAGRDKPKKP